MACKNLNQWMPMSPRKSGGGNSEEEEMNDVDQGDELLDHVRQLIVDLLVDDSRLSANCPLGEVAGHQGEQRDDRRGSKHQSNNPEEDAAAATRREQVLEEKLARTLLELAGEQDNLRLAANAGNTLLEQLRGAREEIDTLQDELEAVQVTTERSERDTQRLRDQNAALENELQRYVPYSSWESSSDQMSTCQSSRRGSLRESFHRSINDGNDACDLCASRETEVIQLEQRADEFRRRCLELELASERDQQRTRELCEEVAQLQQRSEDERLKTARLQHDLDFVTTQLDRRTEEVESARAARDALRRTVRRLEAENEEICTRLAAREEHITKLENSKARTGTQIQVAENRAASAQAETKRVLETLQQLQKQLELRQQHMSGQIGDTGKGDNETEVAPQEKEDRDMEQLLQDATREVTALRLENRVLRRQSSSDASLVGNQLRGRRRKTLCTSSSATTAAEVLALGSREAKQITEITSTASSYRASDIQAASTAFQLPPLDIKAMESDTTAISPPADLTSDVKKRRKMSLELSWVDNPTTKMSIMEVETNSGITAPRDLSVPSFKEVCSGEPDEDEEHAQEDASTPSSSVVKQPGVLSHLSHINDHCVIGGATEVNTSDVHLYVRHSTRRSTFGSTSESEQTRVHELPIEDIKKAAVEPPPQSPLVLGLSFIACATAATAAGLLVRR